MQVKSLDLAGRSILVVEDEPLICLDITSRLRDAGAHVLAASHLEKAMRLADRPDLSAGVLDFNLGAVDSSPVCWRLVERHVPFLFHTGRVSPAFQQWPAAPVLLKPSHAGLIASVVALFG
jgi:DNA-binding response OmpR family regulator